MVINQIKNKNFKPLVYQISKDQDKPDMESNKEQAETAVSVKDKELLAIRTAVLEEINEKIGVEKKKSKKSKIFTVAKSKITESKAPKKVNAKKNIFFLIKTAGLGLIFFVIILLFGIYLAGWQGGLAQTITRFIPLPAAYVAGDYVPLKDFLSDVKALESYLKRNNFQFTAYEIRSKVMTSLVEKKIMERIALANNITVTEEDIKAELAGSVLKENSREQIDRLVYELYGWDFDTYIAKVVRPLVLAERIEDFYNQSSSNDALKQKMADYQRQLLNSPEDFEKLAAEVNNDETKAAAGDWGWFGLGSVNPAIELALLNLEDGQISEMVETADGYHLIKLTEMIVDDQDGKPYFHAGHIFLKKSSFQDYLKEIIKEAKVINLLKI